MNGVSKCEGLLCEVGKKGRNKEEERAVSKYNTVSANIMCEPKSIIFLEFDTGQLKTDNGQQCARRP